ncbi:MAG: hypothetical protein ACKOX6_14800 [Bdellovibrio sp.]
MKKSIFVMLMISTNAFAGTAKDFKAKSIKMIVCQNVASYEEGMPENKLPTTGIKIFKPGSRSDVKPAAGAFLLSEFNLDDQGLLQEYSNQQYYFENIKNGKIEFSFIADWKANGELSVNSDGTAVGFINQKSQITELSCVLKF